MQWFIIFGIIGFIELATIGLSIMALVNIIKGIAWHTGFKQAARIALIVAFIYSAVIFIAENEASTVAAPNESFQDTLKTGLPIYLAVFTVYVFIPASLYILLWSDKLNKKQTKTSGKHKSAGKSRNDRNSKSKTR